MVSTVFFLLAILFQAAVNANEKIRAFDTDVDVPTDCLRAMSSKAPNEAVYCSEKPSDYPQEHIDNYIKDLQQRFGFPAQNQKEDTHNYLDFTEEENCEREKNKNCCASSKIDQPFVHRSGSKLKLVIQSKHFNQKFKLIQCRNESDSTPCFKDFSLVRDGWDTRCTTNKAPVKLYVYNDQKRKMESVEIDVPVSCSCSATRRIMNV